MQLLFRCPACQQTARTEVAQAGDDVRCEACDWSRTIDAGELDDNARPLRCLVCGCHDVWRQKDFSQKLGLLMVGLGILLSTIAWAYTRPLLAIGILMGFALVDLVLYACMSDVLVCYRCDARHRHTNPDDRHAPFDLETAERHRQEAIRAAEQSAVSGQRSADRKDGDFAAAP